MTIHVINCLAQLKEYIKNFSEENCEKQWETMVVNPFWEQLCIYSPFNMDERKPACVKNIEALKKQVDILEKQDFEELKFVFQKIADSLPNYDDDPISVFLVPADDDNQELKVKQNGVVGSALFGNIMIQVNPLADNYWEWVKYVFAHEYHHSVWGNYWMNLHGNELKHNLLQALITDGEADSFALSLYNDLKPSWLYLDENDKIEKMYLNEYEPFLKDQDFDYVTKMFGNEEKGICWCGGYAVGYRIVQKYLSTHKLSFRELLEVPPEDLVN